MKIFKKVLLSFVVAFMLIVEVNAASGTIKASTSAGTIAVGSTFTVTVNVSCSESLGSWEFGISYDSSVISLQSGDTHVVDYATSSGIKSKSYTYKFKAIKSGTGGVRISAPSMVTWDDVNTLFTPSSSNTSVTVKTQAEIEASYSKDNNLKSLSVQGFELSPSFDKDVTSYTVSVPDTTTSIRVSASVNDATARVSGTGDINISEGTNRIEVVVTAQNGSIKTYTILVDVTDLNPIETFIDGMKYSVVKKDDLLTEPVGYSKVTITIDGVEVPAFKSELTKMTVVGLKDENGEIGLFVYDEDRKSFSKYDEIKGASLTLIAIATENDINGFDRIKYKINGIEVDAYQSKYDEGLILAYAMNVETGEENYYIFDTTNNSFVKYNPEMFDNLSTEAEDYKLITIALVVLSGTLFLLAIVLIRKNSKIKKRTKRLLLQLEEIQKQASIEKERQETENSSEEEKTSEATENTSQNRKGKKKRK